MPAMPFPASRPSRRQAARLLAAGLAAPALLCRFGTAAASQPPRLAAGPAAMRLDGPEKPASALVGFDGATPGPVLRARRDEPFRLTLANGLDTPTALHWQGLRIDNRMDGVPGLTQAEALAPGAEAEIAFLPRDAGTFIYRPWHAEHGAGQQARGLAGVLVVEGPEPPAFDRELVLALSDVATEAGRRLLVNGAPELALSARAHERLWLRIANLAHARILELSLAGQVLTLVALDGQPCEPFRLGEGRMTLAPGQRCEVMLDAAGAAGARLPISLSNLMGGQLDGTLAITDGPPPRAEPLPPPAPLAANPIAQELDFRRAFRRDLTLSEQDGALLIDGRPARAPGREPAFKARRGTVVMAGLVNRTRAFQAVHLHGHQARLLDGLDDGWKPYFLDTVLVAPATTARIAFLADNPGRWVVEAQAIGAAEGPLVTWFEVA